MNEAEQIFRVESAELLSDLESALMDLEETPNDTDLVNRAFRAMHTIKGSGGMFGFEEICRLTHQLEDAFDQVRNGVLSVSQSLIDLTLRAKDHIEALMLSDKVEKHPETDAILDQVNVILGQQNTASEPTNTENAQAIASVPDSQDGNDQCVFRIDICPDLNAFETGVSPIPMLRELCELGECDVQTLTHALPDSLEDFDPELLYLSWQVKLITDRPQTDIEDVFIFVADEWSIRIENEGPFGLDSSNQSVSADITEENKCYANCTGYIDELLVDEEPERDAQTENTEPIVESHPNPNQAEPVSNALVSPAPIQSTVKQPSAAESNETIKVRTSKLDKLMDIVGELVIAQARLQQVAAELNEPELDTVNESFERLSNELRDNTLDMRMLPIGTTFSKYRRLVRDVSNELGKKVNLITEGEDTELDKTLIDKLVDPMVHLIRNSLDHGLESSAERIQNGKPEHGEIKLVAFHQESKVVIKITDDGRGMDPNKLIQKARDRNIISPTDRLSDQEAIELIFAPGFSTAEQVSNISGRGVGMDAVKTAVESMGGKIRVHSVLGEGTEMTIELPLTLAIIDGLLVSISNEPYVLPLSMVEECIEVQRTERDDDVSSLIEVRGKLVPHVRLRQWFECDGHSPDIQQAVITRYNDDVLGLVVDEVIGEHQTVIKNLGPAFKSIKGISGATILGTGGIALIVDVPELADNLANSAYSNHIH